MVKIKRIGISLTALAMSFGIMSVASAETTQVPQVERLQIEVASKDTTITKNDLIKKFKELFPKKFDSLSTNDFNMSSGHYFPEDKTVRYELSFSKMIQGKDIHGSITFAGDNLVVENLYLQPVGEADALFPSKVSKEEAQKIAYDFIKEFSGGEKYQLEKNNSNNYYYYFNQLLTEPIRYNFSFVRTENEVEIPDQRMEVTVFGNGEISQFYRYPVSNAANTFDDVKKIKNENEVLSRVQNNLNLQLQYQILHDYRTNERSVQLVYNPSQQFIGVHAINGKWQTINGFTTKLADSKKIEKLVQKPLAPRKNGINVEDAKKIAKELLSINSDKITLKMNSVVESTNSNGKEVIRVDYMYEYQNNGFGTSMELDKQTGEILQFHNMRNDVYREMGQNLNNNKKITSSQALTKAIDYLKKWVPSYLHNYAKPITEPNFDEKSGIYYFSFPRLVNGIVVSGDEISVSVNADGSLNSLFVNAQEIDNWPSTKGILSQKEAEKLFKDALSLKLQYTKENSLEETKHYSLVYVPVYNEKSFTSLDATTGKWTSMFGEKDYPIVSHSTAEEELNYLIQNNILDVKDSNFNADTTVKKGEALKTLVRSISYFYEEYYPQQKEFHQTFDSIGPKHPYYHVVERAVAMGILDSKDGNFNPEANVTREELAVWYIRVLGLEQAAKHAEIYKLDLQDANDVTYTGYVALANKLQLLPAENNQFKPKQTVTYADLAVSTIRLAHKVYERNNANRYY